MSTQDRCAAAIRGLWAILLGSVPTGLVRAGDPPFWVGAAAPCNFTSLAIAIAAVPDGAVIRIASNKTYDSTTLSIVNKSLTLEGGWADCTGSSPIPDPVALNGADDLVLPVIRAESTGTAREVVLRRLHVRGGMRSGIESIGPVNLRIESSRISDNVGNQGGGLHISGNLAGTSQVEVLGTEIGAPVSVPGGGNLAGNEGGGLFCQQGSVLLSRTLIRNNHAINGGGIHLNGCSLHSTTSAWQPGGLPLHTVMIVGNSASARGGGLRVVGASTVFLGQFANAPVIIEDNAAGIDGGGLSLDGNQVQFRGHGVWLRDNHAQLSGGGAGWIGGGASLTLDWPLWLRGHSEEGARGGSHYCFNSHPCNVISGNRIDAGTGAALFVNGGSVSLARTRISNNGEGGRIQFLVHNGGELRLSSSLIEQNDSSGTELFRVLDGSQLRVATSTIVGNQLGGQTVRLFSDGGGNDVQIAHSIIWQPGAHVVLATGADTVTGNCVNANENASIAAVTDDPGFADAGNGDYRLRGGSINVDACPDPFQGAFAFDLIGQARPIDLDRPGSPGPADRGAYELGDPIFANGFELLVPLP